MNNDDDTTAAGAGDATTELDTRAATPSPLAWSQETPGAELSAWQSPRMRWPHVDRRALLWIGGLLAVALLLLGLPSSGTGEGGSATDTAPPTTVVTTYLTPAPAAPTTTAVAEPPAPAAEPTTTAVQHHSVVPDPNATFVMLLTHSGWTAADANITAGRGVCAMHGQYTNLQIINGLSADQGWTWAKSNDFVAAATTAFCPELAGSP